MLPTEMNAIDEEALAALVDDGAMEGKNLEFKRDLPGQTDGDRVRLLRVLTSFANTSGGDLLLGVEAQQGRASGVIGVEGATEDQMRQRIENLCRDGVDPRLAGITLKFVPLENGRSVIVARVAQSWNAPHRVTAGGHSHFYARNSAGSYQMDVGELRAAFTAPERITADIRRFRAERIAAVQSYQTPVEILHVGALILHMLPFSAFSPIRTPRISLTIPERHEFRPFGSEGGSQDVNLEGYVLFRQRREPSNLYTQVYRTGAVECVAAFELWEGENIYKLPGGWMERNCVEMAERVAALLAAKTDVFPLAIGMGLVNVANYRFIRAGGRWDSGLPRTNRNVIEFPTVVVERGPLNAGAALRHTFDMLYNVFSIEASPSYDVDGNFVPPRE